jgi:hypothetical protein
VEYVSYNKKNYEKIDLQDKKNYKCLEHYLRCCSKNYTNFLNNYFVDKGGVLTNEFKFVDVRR